MEPPSIDGEPSLQSSASYCPLALLKLREPANGNQLPRKTAAGDRFPGGPFSRNRSIKSRSSSPLPSPPTHTWQSSAAAWPVFFALWVWSNEGSSPQFSTRLGIHGLGGRMGTRNIIGPDDELIFDHAAQFFTVSDPLFGEMVNGWLAKGLVQEWSGRIGEIEAGAGFVPFPSSPPRYVGVNGMRSLADSLLSQSGLINVVRPCWISKLEPFNGLWHLSENGKPRGQFDAIVIAHNGKCANRLLSTAGLPLVARQMKRLDLSSIWALMAAFDDPLPIPFEGAFVKGMDALSWMGNNSTKLSDPKGSKQSRECWTFFSTAAYGKKNKVPQESIPNETGEKVKQNMLEGVEAVIGMEKGQLQIPSYTKLQLWGAALPTNSPKIPCIFDAQGRAGICGDWLLGSNMESAALSGMALANHVSLAPILFANQ
ncbi:PSPTO_1126 [Linum grandiflorum]